MTLSYCRGIEYGEPLVCCSSNADYAEQALLGASFLFPVTLDFGKNSRGGFSESRFSTLWPELNIESTAVQVENKIE